MQILLRRAPTACQAYQLSEAMAITALQLSRARTDRKPKAASGKQRILAQAAMPTDRMAGRWARLSRLGAATQAEALAPTTDQEIRVTAAWLLRRGRPLQPLHPIEGLQYGGARQAGKAGATRGKLVGAGSVACHRHSGGHAKQCLRRMQCRGR